MSAAVPPGPVGCVYCAAAVVAQAGVVRDAVSASTRAATGPHTCPPSVFRLRGCGYRDGVFTMSPHLDPHPVDQAPDEAALQQLLRGIGRLVFPEEQRPGGRAVYPGSVRGALSEVERIARERETARRALAHRTRLLAYALLELGRAADPRLTGLRELPIRAGVDRPPAPFTPEHPRALTPAECERIVAGAIGREAWRPAADADDPYQNPHRITSMADHPAFDEPGAGTGSVRGGRDV